MARLAGRLCVVLALVACLFLLSRAALDWSVRALAPAEPGLWVTPLDLDFGPVGVGFTSAQQVVTITNTASRTLGSFAGGGVNAPFYATQDCAGGVAPGGTCHYYFRFKPTAVGAFSTTSSSSTSAGPFAITLRGTGVGPGLAVSASSLDFGSVMVGGASVPQTVTIRNTGMSTLTNFAGGGVPAPFMASQDCAAGVPPGGTCHYYFRFSPSAAGAFSTTSSSSTNAGPFSVALRGSGRTLLLISGQYATPLSIDFGPVGVGMSSARVAVTITNQNWIGSVTDWAGGGVSSPFSAGQDCAPELAAGKQCRFYYTFKPTSTGVFTATSRITNSGGEIRIALRGTGVGPALSVSPLVLDFGPVALGQSSPYQYATIRNTGMSTLTNFAGGGVYPPFSAAQNCAAGVPPGGKCYYYFRYSPTAKGVYRAVSSSGTNAGAFTIKLVGGETLRVYLPIVTRGWH